MVIDMLWHKFVWQLQNNSPRIKLIPKALLSCWQIDMDETKLIWQLNPRSSTYRIGIMMWYHYKELMNSKPSFSKFLIMMEEHRQKVVHKFYSQQFELVTTLFLQYDANFYSKKHFRSISHLNLGYLINCVLIKINLKSVDGQLPISVSVAKTVCRKSNILR